MTESSESPAVPESRREPLGRVLGALRAADNVVLTTHVGADGDGAGSEVALASWLSRRGAGVRIANPTPFPERLDFLIEHEDWIADPDTDRAREAIRDADLFVVLDTGVPHRIGYLAEALEDRNVAIVDHHPPEERGIDAFGPRDPSACATAELIYDLLLMDGEGRGGTSWPPAIVTGLYTGILTDTGSFEHTNTTPRTHLIAADLLRRGARPERIHRRLFGRVPLRRIRVLRAALERLEVDPALPIAWMTMPRELIGRLEATSDDLGGLVDYPRSIEDTEVAVFLRGAGEGQTKISWRSNGPVDVNRVAARFGGGGHPKAAGALVGRSLDNVRDDVLEATREAVASLGARVSG